MLTIVCLTKSYRADDLEAWLKYHVSFCSRLVLIDNDSFYDVSNLVSNFDSVEYHKISGFPDQWRLFGDILNGRWGIKFNEDELVVFIDDDEFLWYDECVFSSLECALRANFKQLGCLLIPEILMSTHHLKDERTQILPFECYYRRNDYSSQGKACVLWKPWCKYSFIHGKKEKGHVPWIDKIRMSDVVGSGVSKTTYGICDYDAPLRLYHYHIKSRKDWEVKISRGSAAMKSEAGENGSYDPYIVKDKKFGSYDVIDLTMKNEFEKKINS